MKPAAFLFDLDGTLLDTEALWTAAIVEWLADRGSPTTAEFVAPLVFGHSWLDIQATLHEKFPQLPKTSAEEDAKTLRPYYARRAVNPASQVIPGAVAFLKKVSRIAPCVVVSGSPHDDVVQAVELCGVENFVRFVLGAEDYGRGKPAPDGYLKAASMLEVDASECVVVEDSTAGVQAGRTAGMRVIGVDRNKHVQQDFAGCEWLVHDLSELDADVVFGDADER